VLLLEIPLALILAFLFSVSRGKAFWRAIYWLPMVTNIAAIAYLWGFLLDESRPNHLTRWHLFIEKRVCKPWSRVTAASGSCYQRCTRGYFIFGFTTFLCQGFDLGRS
jgi:ABC-type sugar transport system permease subunit